MRYFFVSVSQENWTEKHYYLGTSNNVQELAKTMYNGGRRTILRNIEADTEAEFWYKVGKRKLDLMPPSNHEKVYQRGLGNA